MAIQAVRAMTDYRDRAYARYRAAGPAEAEPSAGGIAFLRQVVRRHFPAVRDAAIVDLGCGAGFLIREARRAGYVAIEKVTGTLGGRAGTFALQHSATMTRGEPHMSITTVPDSGTGELSGIAGKMTIRITDGKHFYEFEYTLPAQ